MCLYIYMCVCVWLFFSSLKVIARHTLTTYINLANGDNGVKVWR